MRITGIALALCLLIAVGGILLLMALPSPGVDGTAVDRHTGEVLPGTGVLRQAELDAALATGDVGRAHQALSQWPVSNRLKPDVAPIFRVLEAELSPPAAAVTAGRELAAPFQLDGATSPNRTIDSTVAWLALYAQDEVIALNTERLFTVEDDDVANAGIDSRAAVLAARLRRNGDVSGAACMAMARVFHNAGRPRARDRWYRRALTRGGPRLTIARAWIAEGRLLEAEALTATLIDDPNGEVTEANRRAFWTLRSDLSRWLGNRQAEQDAIDQLLALSASPSATNPAERTDEQREELRTASARRIELLRAAGQLVKAAHAELDQARTLGDATALRRAAENALAAGLLDEGLAALADLPDGAERHRRIAQVLGNDLRFDEAIPHLEAALRASRDPTDASALAALYRRLRAVAPLADLLLHYPQVSDDPREVFHLLVAQGRYDDARAELQRVAREPLVTAADAHSFFRVLPWLVDAEVDDLDHRAIAAAHLAAPAHLKAILPALLASRDPGRAAIDVLSERFPDENALWGTRVDALWNHPDPAVAAAQAEAMALRRPFDRPVLRVWVFQASRAGNVAAELRARRALHDLSPTIENTRAVAWLLTDSKRHREAATVWRELLDTVPEAKTQLIDSTIRAAQDDAALDAAVARLMELWRRDDQPGAVDNRDALLELADGLFRQTKPAAAQRVYAAVLAASPNHPVANLRTGLILSWRNQPAHAISYFRTALAAQKTEADRTPIRYHLAEALWAEGQDKDEALDLYRDVLTAAAANDSLLPADGPTVARALHRVGRTNEAIAAYRDFLDGNPGNREVMLDLAEVLSETGDHAGAEQTLVNARAAFVEAALPTPDHRRLLRVEAQHRLRTRDYGGARLLLERSDALYTVDGGELSDLGRAQEWSGEYGQAQDSYQRWSALQPDRFAAAAAQRVSDRLATHLGVQGNYLGVGNDSAIEVGLFGAFTIDERTRVQGRVGWGDYTGRSQAVGGGNIDIDTDTPLLDLGVVHRYGIDSDQIGAGVRFHPDAAGDRDFSAWIEQHWQSEGPFWSVSLRGVFDELWTQPAAAAGLGGRRSGVQLAAFRALGDRAWVSVDGAWRRARARAPLQARLEDDNVSGGVQIGRRWTDGDIAITDRFRAHRAPAGPESPYLGHGPAPRNDLHFATWVGFTADHLLGDAALTTILPLADRVHFLYLASRLDRRFGTHFGASIDGMVGTDLQRNTRAWEAALALTWRPAFTTEFHGRVGIGDAFGRAGFDSQTVFAHVEGVLRW